MLSCEEANRSGRAEGTAAVLHDQWTCLDLPESERLPVRKRAVRHKQRLPDHVISAAVCTLPMSEIPSKGKDKVNCLGAAYSCGSHTLDWCLDKYPVLSHWGDKERHFFLHH